MADDWTVRARAIESWRISPVTSLVVGWLMPAVGELMRQLDVAVLDDAPTVTGSELRGYRAGKQLAERLAPESRERHSSVLAHDVASAVRSLAYSRGREAGFRANLARSGPSQPTEAVDGG